MNEIVSGHGPQYPQCANSFLSSLPGYVLTFYKFLLFNFFTIETELSPYRVFKRETVAIHWKQRVCYMVDK
jgi:hypothetical protein